MSCTTYVGNASFKYRASEYLTPIQNHGNDTTYIFPKDTTNRRDRGKTQEGGRDTFPVF